MLLFRSFPHLENDELEILAIRANNLPIPDGFTAQSLITLLKYEFAHPKVSKKDLRKNLFVNNA